MQGLHKVLDKMLHYGHLIGFWIFFRFWICQGSKYAMVTQGSEQNAPLYLFDSVLNMPLVLKWNAYREFLRNSYSRDSWYSEYAPVSQYIRFLNVIGVLICYRFIGYIDRVLNMLNFWIYPGSEYARVRQGSEYAWIRLNNFWISLGLHRVLKKTPALACHHAITQFTQRHQPLHLCKHTIHATHSSTPRTPPMLARIQLFFL